MEGGEKSEVDYTSTSSKREHADASEEFDPYEGQTLHRQLKNRHIAMISLGGVIGKLYTKVTTLSCMSLVCYHN